MANYSASDIAKLLRRAPPMIMLDRVTSIIPNKSCEAFKNLTYNEWFFPSHFPDYPIMPGSLQIECFTQVVALPLIVHRVRSIDGNFPLLLAGVDKVRFFAPVRPGDRLEFTVDIKRNALGVVLAVGEAFVSGKKVSECQITYRDTDWR